MSTLDGSASVDELVAYNDDWMNKYHGKSQVIVKPKSTEEVAAVMKYCNEQNIAVVPQGGNTGLVGGYHRSHSAEIQVVVSPFTTRSCSRSPT
jgi:FAD/FMN-containing dehydrogenase